MAARPGTFPRLLLVTGMSGAGKSTVLHALEDMGWDCVDNLPTNLLEAFAHGQRGARRNIPVAVGMDVRSRGFDPKTLHSLIQSIEGVTPEILYLDCAGSELIRRYDETRRRHPLAPDRPAEDGVAKERASTAALRDTADRRRQVERGTRVLGVALPGQVHDQGSDVPRTELAPAHRRRR